VNVWEVPESGICTLSRVALLLGGCAQKPSEQQVEGAVTANRALQLNGKSFDGPGIILAEGIARMAKIDKLTVSLNGLLSAFVKFVEAWQPPELKAETAYRDHLVEHLRAAVPEDARVEREYRHRGTTIDIYVSWKGQGPAGKTPREVCQGPAKGHRATKAGDCLH
jgi:hypothetical protein